MPVVEGYGAIEGIGIRPDFACTHLSCLPHDRRRERRDPTRSHTDRTYPTHLYIDRNG